MLRREAPSASITGDDRAERGKAPPVHSPVSTRPGRPLPVQVVDDEGMLVPTVSDPLDVGMGRVEIPVGMFDDIRV